MSHNSDSQVLHDIDNALTRLRSHLAPRAAIGREQLKNTIRHRTKTSGHTHQSSQKTPRQLKKRNRFTHRSMKKQMEYVRSFRGKKRKH